VMRRLAAILAAFLLCSFPAKADVAAGNGVTPSAMIVSRSAFSGAAITQNAWTTLTSPTVTTGVSSGPLGAWDVTLLLGAEESAVNTAGVAICIEGAAAGTSAAGSYSQNGAAVCNTSIATPTNPLAGATITSGTTHQINAQAVYSAQYPNNTTVSFTCQGITSSAALLMGGYALLSARQV
jgi:hypothetical protein